MLPRFMVWILLEYYHFVKWCQSLATWQIYHLNLIYVALGARTYENQTCLTVHRKNMYVDIEDKKHALFKEYARLSSVVYMHTGCYVFLCGNKCASCTKGSRDWEISIMYIRYIV